MNPAAVIVECAQSAAAFFDRLGPAGSSLSSLHNTELLDAVRAIADVQRAADVAQAKLAAEVARRSQRGDPASLSKQQGVRDAAALIAKETGGSLSAARALVDVGEAVTPRIALSGERVPAAHPHIAEALDAGSITVDAARAIVGTLRSVAPKLAADDLLELERQLVATAVGWAFTLEVLQAYLKKVPDHIDPDSTETRADALHRQATGWRRQLDTGLTRFVFDLDPERAAYLIAAIDAKTAPRRNTLDHTDAATEGDAIEDTRTTGERTADAIVVIAKQAIAWDDGQVAGTTVRAVVTMTLEQLQGGLGAVTLAGVEQPGDAATARRMAVDADIIPVVLGGDSQIFDQGVAKRRFTPAQRVALAVLFGGCAAPNCQAPPGWCEAAHIRAWKDGGLTDLMNALLLCAFHHRMFDTQGWACYFDDDGRPMFVPPAHVDITRRPRRGGRAPLPLPAAA